MRLHEELRRRLTKVSDLVLDRFPYHGIVNSVQLDVTLVRQVVENIGRTYGFRA